MPQASPVISLLREAYPGSFGTETDATVRDYFYRLMFEPQSFGDVKQGQQFRQQVLSDIYGLAKKSIPGVVPPEAKEFVVWSRKQALGMAPKQPNELQEFSKKAFDYEQRYGELAHPVLFAEEFAKNLFGKPAASLVSLASIVPGTPREMTQKVADAISPRIDFGHHVTEKYGTIAGLGYAFGEALVGFGPVAGGAKTLAGGVAASRILGLSQAAGAIARNEALFNTLFFGSYSAGEYNRSMLEQGKEPTAEGFAANLGAGMALGMFFPKAKKVLETAKDARPWVNNVLSPMLDKKVADLKSMSTGDLRSLLISKGYKSRKDITHALNAVRYLRNYKGNVTKDLLKQSTGAGLLGVGTGGVSQMTQGMPIDVPSLIQSAVFMQGFHAHGVLGAIGKPIGRAKPGKIEDGILKLGIEGDRRKLIDSLRPFYEEPDIAPEEGIRRFAEIARRDYGVEKIEIEPGQFKTIDEFLDLVNPEKIPEKAKSVIGRIGRARAEKDAVLASKLEAELDSYFAQIARARGESPTDVPFADPDAPDVPTAKKAQSMYMWLYELIGNNLGRKAQDAFRRGLGTDTPLFERMKAEPEVARILDRFPAANAVERLFDATVRNREVTPELWEAAKMFVVPKGLLEAPARYPEIGGAPERGRLPEARTTEPGREYTFPMKAAPEFEITDAMRQDVKKNWGEEASKSDAFVRHNKQPIESLEHYKKLTIDAFPDYEESLKKPVGEKGYVRLHEVKKGNDTYILEEVGGGKYNVFKVGVPAGEKFNEAINPMSTYLAADIEKALKIKVPVSETGISEKPSASDVMAAELEVLMAKKSKPIVNSLKTNDVKSDDLAKALNNSTKKENLGIIYGGIPIDPSAIAKLFGRGKRAAVEDALRENPSLADNIAELGRMLHTWRSTRDPFLVSLSKHLFYGDPEKLVTPQQWKWINKAVEFNRTNPYMNDGRSGTINASDFIHTVLGRRNYHPEFARDANQLFEPMTREEARDVLKGFAKISESIRDHNWPIALRVLLPVALKKYSVRVENDVWNPLYAYEQEINGIRAKKDRFVKELNSSIGKGDEINPATTTERFQTYNEKHYGYIWKMSRENGWMPEGEENRWGRGRTIAQEIHGLSVGVIPFNEPFLHSKSVEAARAWANPLKPKGKYVMSFRDRAWHFLNNGLKRFEYPRIRGRLYVDSDYFRDVYTHWKMQSEKTTPENSDAMRAKFQKQADKILTDDTRKTETINAIMEGKKLGKIVDSKDRNIYYPFFDPKLSEKLLEAEAAIEEGRLPSGAIGKLMHAQHRKASVEYHVATGEFDPVRDINTYVENVTSYLWRSAVRYHTWKGTKNLRRDIAENPQHARLFQHHIEIIDKLKSDLLDRQDRVVDRVSQNIGLMASGIMLAHPKTVFRNIVGGHALTAIHSGLRDFGEAWAFRKTAAGKRIVDRAGFEASALFSEAESMVVDPKRFRAMLTRQPNMARENQIERMVRLVNSYALSRPIPIVTDLIPGLQDLVKGFSFSGSEVSLRETAFLSGFKANIRRVMESPKRRDKIRVIYGNSAKEILARVEKQYAEIEIVPDDVLSQIKKNPATYKGAKKFMLKIVGPETNAEQRARAYRAGLQGGAESVMMTQFIYSRLNLPSVMKHPLGRVVLLFRKYTWNRFNFAVSVIKDAMPQRGGGPEELARLLRFAIALSAAKALGAYIGFNLYRFVEDDVVSMLASINDWFSQDPERRKQATFGKPAWQFLTGPEFSRNIDVLINADMPSWEKALTVSHLPYSRATVDAIRERQKVVESGKNVYEALMNFHFGLYRYNYGGSGRRRRRSRRSR